MQLRPLSALIATALVIPFSLQAAEKAPTNPMQSLIQHTIGLHRYNTQPATTDQSTAVKTDLAQSQRTAKILQTQISQQLINLAKLEAHIENLKKKMHQHKQKLNGFYWVEETGLLPQHTYRTPLRDQLRHKSTQVICQTPYAGNLYPGTLTNNRCHFSYGGYEHQSMNYKVLVSKKAGFWIQGSQAPNIPMANPRFHPIAYGPIPATSFANTSNIVIEPPHTATTQSNVDPVIGGHENGHYINICRVKMNGRYYIGKVVSQTCMFPLSGREASIPSYQVLLSHKPKPYHGSAILK